MTPDDLVSRGRWTRRLLLRTGALTIGGLSTGGCAAAASSIFLGDPPAQYTLTPKSTFDSTLPTVSWQLLIEPPVAASALDSVRIALKEDPFEIQYFANVAWSARAPAMVQTLLVESFENSERIVSVGRESIGLRADYVLKSELREFQAEYGAPGMAAGAPPQVRVRLNAKLVRIPQRLIIASQNFERLEAPSSNRTLSIIEAFDVALGGVIRNIVEFTLREGQADWLTREADGPSLSRR